MAIYVTGDTHGGIDISKLSNSNFSEGKSLTRDDYVIICGDFGLPFLPSDTTNDPLSSDSMRSARATYQYWIKWLSERPYTVLWCDGNHDNHSFWYKQPSIEWNGGLVNMHPDADNVIHLKRGEYYTLDGYTFWVMGGATSIDKYLRQEGLSWWPEEVPSLDEMNHGIETLEAHDKYVDYVITHTVPQFALGSLFRSTYESEPTRSYLEYVYSMITFKEWFCGHLHIDRYLDFYKIQVLYDDIVKIER